MRITPEMQEAVRARRKQVWLAHCRDGKTLRELANTYRVSQTAIRTDLYKWTEVIARACKTLGFPYLHVTYRSTSVTWRRQPKILTIVHKGHLVHEFFEVQYRLGFIRLREHLEALGISEERYPFDPDNHPPLARPTATAAQPATHITHLINPAQVINSYRVRQYSVRCAKVSVGHVIMVTKDHAVIFHHEIRRGTYNEVQLEDLYLEICKEIAIVAHQSLATVGPESAEIIFALNKAISN